MRLELELGLDCFPVSTSFVWGRGIGGGRTIAFGEPRTELRQVGVVLALDGGRARGEGAAEVRGGVVAGGGAGAAVAAVVLVVAGFEVVEAVVLAAVELGLLALLDDAVVEVDAGGEGAGDGGDEGGEDEALLGGVLVGCMKKGGGGKGDVPSSVFRQSCWSNSSWAVVW